MTYNEASFEREYESRWTGTVEDAFYSGDHFDACRRLLQPEYKASERTSAGAYYVITADIGRWDCDSVATIIKVSPQSQGQSLKAIVNIEVMHGAHGEDQAIWLKKLYYKYHARRLVIDGNGVGQDVVDWLVKSQVDPVTGEILPDFGVYGGTKEDEPQRYKQFKTDITELDALYIVKAHAPENTECYVYLQSQLQSQKLRFLIDEKAAKLKLLNTQKGQKMTPEERKIYLEPFTRTSMLRDEITNLREDNEGVNIILKRANKGIPKDKFSSLIYGLYYIKQEEDRKKKRVRFRASDFAFMN